MSELFSGDFLFRNAILGGLGVVLLCSLVGIYLVLRRLVLIGVALPQASAAGVAAVFWITGHGHSGSAQTHAFALAGSLVATFGALALLVLGQRRGRSPAEWGVGALFAISSAATILLVAINPAGDMEMASLLRGELLTIGDGDLRLLGFALVGVAALFFLFRRDLLLSSFDPEFARTLGRDPVHYDLLLHGLIGGVIALGVMTAGPLVVFGFLVLPALAALRAAPGLVSAFAISAALASLSFVGGFWISYRADLPAGPVCVAVAAVCWGLVTLAMRLRVRRRGASLLLLAVVLALPQGCASRWRAAQERASSPLPGGTLPEALAAQPIAVLPFVNATGQPLRMPQGLLTEASRAVGRTVAEPSTTVPDRLQERAGVELERRGFRVVPLEQVRAAVPHALEPPLAGAGAAASAGLDGPVLVGTLRRFTVTESGLLLVRLELALVDAKRQEILWTGIAKRPVPIQSALTWQEILLDAGGPIFAEAFGSP
jgi:ABC-type Mn2+/Zn2+ transport system permease subunit